MELPVKPETSNISQFPFQPILVCLSVLHTKPPDGTAVGSRSVLNSFWTGLPGLATPPIPVRRPISDILTVSRWTKSSVAAKPCFTGTLRAC